MNSKILIKIGVAIALAIAVGFWVGPQSEIGGIPYVRIFGLIGQLFLNALTLIVVPLVASSIILGTARMGSENAMGTLGKKTFLFIFLNLSSAVFLGLVISLLLGGTGSSVSADISTAQMSNLSQLQAQGEEGVFQKIEQMLLKVAPSNILAAASQGQMLGIIGFCLLFGYFISKIEKEPATVLLSFFKGIFDVMMKITHFIMKALPIGVFGLVAKVVATMGMDSIRSVGWVSFLVILGLASHTLVTLPFFLKIFARVNPWHHLKAMAPALLTGFSTSSSAATMPVTMECLEKKVGVSNRICSFTLPLGTSLNNAGSAIYVCIAAIFIAQAYGMILSIPLLLTIVGMTIFAALGIAGIPSGCLIGLMVVLNAINIPLEAIALVLATERILDMGRTVVNVFGNSCLSVLVARVDGEENILVPAKA